MSLGNIVPSLIVAANSFAVGISTDPSPIIGVMRAAADSRFSVDVAAQLTRLPIGQMLPPPPKTCEEYSFNVLSRSHLTILLLD